MRAMMIACMLHNKEEYREEQIALNPYIENKK